MAPLYIRGYETVKTLRSPDGGEPILTVDAQAHAGSRLPDPPDGAVHNVRGEYRDGYAARHADGSSGRDRGVERDRTGLRFAPGRAGLSGLRRRAPARGRRCVARGVL